MPRSGSMRPMTSRSRVGLPQALGRARARQRSGARSSVVVATAPVPSYLWLTSARARAGAGRVSGRVGSMGVEVSIEPESSAIETRTAGSAADRHLGLDIPALGGAVLSAQTVRGAP